MSVSNIFGVIYRSTRRADDRMISRLLALAGLCPLSPLSVEIDAMLRQRMSDCRDLLVLRGVRPQRLTVLQLVGRRVSQDAECFEQIARLSAVHGPRLLHAVCALMAVVGRSGFPTTRSERKSQAKAVRSAAPVASTAPRPANDPDLVMPADLESAIVALKQTNLDLHAGLDRYRAPLRTPYVPRQLAA